MAVKFRMGRTAEEALVSRYIGNSFETGRRQDIFVKYNVLLGEGGGEALEVC